MKQSGSRRNASGLRSTTATEWPFESSSAARPDPTRPHPTMTTCKRSDLLGPERPRESRRRGSSSNENGLPARNQASVKILSRLDALRPREGVVLSAASGVHYELVDTQTTATPARLHGLGRHPEPEALRRTWSTFPNRGRTGSSASSSARRSHSDELEHERLGKPTALAVFASDNLSSSAYATEEILHVLVPVVGVARLLAGHADHDRHAAWCSVFLILSYRQTIKEYPTRRRRLHRHPRQLRPPSAPRSPASSLLTDYILTVVGVGRGGHRGARRRSFPALQPVPRPDRDRVRRCIIAFGNLKGVKESGKVFAVPTYFFIVDMACCSASAAASSSPATCRRHHRLDGTIARPVGQRRRGFLYGATHLRRAARLRLGRRGGHRRRGHLQRRPRVQGSRRGRTPARRWSSWAPSSACMFLGLSMLASQIHPVPYEDGRPDGDLPRSARPSSATRPGRQRAVRSCSRPARC